MRLLTFLFLTTLAYAADPREAAVTAASESFGKCWNAHDVDCLGKLLTEDAILEGGGTFIDKSAFLTRMKDGRYGQFYDAAGRREVKTRFYGGTAVETFYQTSPSPNPARTGTVEYTGTEVWITQDGNTWRMASLSGPEKPAPSDYTLGVWKYNAGKSSPNAGAAPFKSLTIYRSAAEGVVYNSARGETADGSKIDLMGTYRYDGVPTALVLFNNWDAIAAKRTDARHVTEERTKSGTPYRVAAEWVVSPDRRSLTITTKGINAEGKPVSQVSVFER